MIYLASPYSHPDPSIREQRFHAACRTMAALIRAGHRVFSPVAHTRALTAYGLPTDWRFWEPHDRAYLERCEEVVILTLEGWDASRGVQAEIQIARELGIPVRYLASEDAAVAPTLARVAEEAGG